MWRMYRRRLPHWRSKSAIYFITWRIHSGRPDLSPAERDCVVRTLKHSDRDRYRLYAYVIMNDHVHVVAEPKLQYPLERIVQAWKSSTAHRFQKDDAKRVWQSEYMDRIIRNARDLERTIEYVIGNPFERWPSLTEYPWLWADGLDEDG